MKSNAAINNQSKRCPKCKKILKLDPTGKLLVCPDFHSCGHAETISQVPFKKTPELVKPTKPTQPQENGPKNEEKREICKKPMFVRPRGEDMPVGEYKVEFGDCLWVKHYSSKPVIYFYVLNGKYKGDELLYPCPLPKEGMPLRQSNLWKLFRAIARARGIELVKMEIDTENPIEWLKKMCKGLEFTVETSKVEEDGTECVKQNETRFSFN